MKAKLEYLGEWAGTDVIAPSEEKAKEMSLDDLMEIIRVRGLSIDVNILIAGHKAILGCYTEGDGTATYSLEVRVPLIAQQYSEFNFDDVSKAVSALKQVKQLGYYLEGQTDGVVECYKSGPLSELEREIESMGDLLSKAPASVPDDP